MIMALATLLFFLGLLALLYVRTHTLLAYFQQEEYDGARFLADPIGRPRGRVRHPHFDRTESMLGEHAADLLLDLVHRGTAGVRRRDRDDDSRIRYDGVAHDPQLHDAQHRNLRIAHARHRVPGALSFTLPWRERVDAARRRSGGVG